MKNIALFFLMITAISFIACSEDEPLEGPLYIIPDTYNFDNVDYSGQTQRLAMLLEMKNYMAESRTPGQALDADRLKAMYTNNADKAQWTGTYEASKQIKSKTIQTEQALFEELIYELVAASQSQGPGTQGQSGVVVSNDGSKQYLLGDDGLDHAQLIEKGLMGACFYYQATAVYMGEDRMNVDNETVVPGEGTDMEHHWDEAFGYLGVPKTFPSVTEGVFFWGDYSNKRDPQLDCNQRIMDALIKGRAAITKGDLVTRDEAIADARLVWEEISAATAVHYLNISLNNFDDMAILGHGLSEAIAFTYCLKFNPNRRLTLQQIDDLLVLMGGSADFSEMDLYNIGAQNLQTAKDQFVSTYGLEAVADEL